MQNVSAFAPNTHKFAVGQWLYYAKEQCAVQVIEPSFRVSDVGKHNAPPGYRVLKRGMVSAVMELDLAPLRA